MARDACDALDLQHSLSGDVPPLPDRLGSNFAAQGPGKAGAALYCPLGLCQGSRFQFGYSTCISHTKLKAQLSLQCK